MIQTASETTRKQGVRGSAVADPFPTHADALSSAQAAAQGQEIMARGRRDVMTVRGRLLSASETLPPLYLL